MKEHEKKVIKAATSFNGIYLPGFFIRNPMTVTALSLLFDKVHLPNQLEIVIAFAKTHNIVFHKNFKDKDATVSVKSYEKNDMSDPFENLDKRERQTAEKYMIVCHNFCLIYYELFPTVFTTGLLPKNKVLNVKLLKKGVNGEENLYRVTPVPHTVTLNGLDEITNKIDLGYIPIIGQEKVVTGINALNDNKTIAGLLAIKSVEMLLPTFKTARSEHILEARDRLSDLLPLFWASMLNLSVDAKKIISQSKSTKEAILECQNIVDTTVRPSLVELVKKMEMERKNFFYRILSPVTKCASMLFTPTGFNPAQLTNMSLAIANNVSSEFVQRQQTMADLKSSNGGLTYLLRLGHEFSK